MYVLLASCRLDFFQTKKNQMFQPKYTMNGLGFDDCMSANGSVHQRALQAELRSYLPSLTRPLNDCIVRTLTAEIYDNKPLAGEWRALEIFPMAKRLITAANALVFFGPEVSNDPIFLKAALEYPEHLMETAEVLRLLPSWIAPFAAPYLMRRHRALQILLDRLTPIVEARLQRTAPATENRDCIQFFINAAARKKQQDEWPVQRIIQVLLGIWFASVHQPAMCLFYALDDLCLHPEYTTALRDELDAANAESPRDIASLSLLNGFLKESARLNPTDSISLRRKVLQPFTLDDGTMLAKGDIACIPLRPLLQDPDIYTEALTFNPYRFVNSGQLDKSKHSISTASDFTDADITFPIWGLGKRACPGRHYASHLLKLILAQILVHYDLKMADDSLHNKSRHFFWRSAIVPRARASLHFRERSIEISS